MGISIGGTGGGGGGGGTGDALTTNPLSQFAATTSLQLKGVISDESGSGAAVFATSPVLVTPTLGDASATRITVGEGTSSLVSIAAGIYANSGFNFVTGNAYYYQGANAYILMSGSGLIVNGSAPFGFSSGDVTAAAADLKLQRDAANTLAQRNGTNPQTSRLYETYTDASNYSRLSISAPTGGPITFASEAAGTGTVRQMAFTGASQWGFGGVTSSFPALKRSSAILQGRLADDSAFCEIQAKFKSSDGTAGATAGPFTVITSITVKDGLVTAISGS